MVIKPSPKILRDAFLSVELLSQVTVLAGDSSEVASGLATRLGAELIACNTRTFPDGESKITLPRIPHGHCVVVQSTIPPVDTNVIHLLSLVHKASDHAKMVTAVVPYMGYARQDKEFLAGEVVTLRVVLELLRAAGADHIMTVDVHNVDGLAYFEDAVNVTAIPQLARHFGTMDLVEPLSVSPDQGGRSRAEMFSNVLGIQSMALDKERDRKTGNVRIRNDSVDVSGRDIILVDDMISTGGSMLKSIEFLKGHGCGRVFVTCTHGLLVGGAAQKITKAGALKIVSSNTIPNSTTAVDVSGVISEILEEKYLV